MDYLAYHKHLKDQPSLFKRKERSECKEFAKETREYLCEFFAFLSPAICGV